MYEVMIYLIGLVSVYFGFKALLMSEEIISEERLTKYDDTL
jgi:hypothetical protein